VSSLLPFSRITRRLTYPKVWRTKASTMSASLFTMAMATTFTFWRLYNRIRIREWHEGSVAQQSEEVEPVVENVSKQVAGNMPADLRVGNRSPVATLAQAVHFVKAQVGQ